ncbi:MAG: hypothetical protein B6229_08055 [Spirochaetaceae bacterium 4572_7]|nr:MAG: hypothetical protein B6229_08055 [Spirochaetaceae bacterium 4572_7]
MYELNNRAVELSKEGRLNEAIHLFEKALDAMPNDSNLNFNISLVYMKQEKFKEAVEFLKKSINTEAGDDNLREIGVCYIRLKEYDKARKYLIRAFTEFGSSDTNNVLGVLFFQLKHFDEAKRYFENATKLNKNNKDAWFNLSDTYKELGMDREAQMATYQLKQLEI